MTDAELRDAAVAALKRTTVSYPTWKRNVDQNRYSDVQATEWWKAFDFLSRQFAVAPTPAPEPTPTPTPEPTPVGGVLELAGTFSGDAFRSAVNAAPSGQLTVRPKVGQTVLVNGPVPARDYTTIERITFDGGGRTANSWMTDWTNFKLLNCTFRNFYEAGVAGSHSEALYLGGGTRDGVIDGCTFDNNGTTAHIFFTWFGGSAGAGAYDHGNYPRRICVKNSVFRNGHNPWFAIQWREEIPVDCGINVDPSNVFIGPGPQRPLRVC